MYTLVYGSEVVAPVDVALSTSRVVMYSEDVNGRKRSMDLDLLEEWRIASRLKLQSFKEQVKKAYDKRVFKRPIKIGDWVLQKIEGTTRHITVNKLTLNREGPYLVKMKYDLALTDS